MPQALPLHEDPIGYLTCKSLRYDASDDTKYGFEYRIPPSKYLNEGDEVKVTWNAYTNFFAPVLIPGAFSEKTFPNITKEQADNGIVWLIEPYATHLLPIWQDTAQIGKGEVAYTITGKPAASTPTNTQVVLSQGEGTCNVPPPKP